MGAWVADRGDENTGPVTECSSTGPAYLAFAMSRAAVFLLALLTPWVWNTWNLAAIRDNGKADQLLRADRTLATADDHSYLAPMDDLLAAWGVIAPTGHPVKAEFRTPGYGLWYLLFRSMLSEQVALVALRSFQLLLFALTALMLWHTLERFGIRPWIRTVSVLVCVAMPTFSGFLYYTLTEAVTPALCVLLLCDSLLYHRDGKRRELLVGVALWALLILTRPVLAWAGLPLVVAVLLRSEHRVHWRTVLVVTSIAAAPTLLWWGVNMARYGGPLSLHPVYVPESTTIFRPTHRAFWELAKSWGMHGDRFHGIMEGAHRAALHGDTSVGHALEFISTAPVGHLDATKQEALMDVFQRWQHFTATAHAEVLRSGSSFPRGPIAEEHQIVQDIDAITSVYRHDHALRYHVVVPLGVLRQLIVHSNLNLYLFQHTYRGQWWMEGLRWASLMLHVALFMGLFVCVFWAPSPVLRAVAIGAWLYIGYLAYEQRGVEERYTLPVLHLAMVLAPFLIEHAMERWRAKASQ
jgi:hypothetical protein